MQHTSKQERFKAEKKLVAVYCLFSSDGFQLFSKPSWSGKLHQRACPKDGSPNYVAFTCHYGNPKPEGLCDELQVFGSHSRLVGSEKRGTPCHPHQSHPRGGWFWQKIKIDKIEMFQWLSTLQLAGGFNLKPFSVHPVNFQPKCPSTKILTGCWMEDVDGASTRSSRLQPRLVGSQKVVFASSTPLDEWGWKATRSLVIIRELLVKIPQLT